MDEIDIEELKEIIKKVKIVFISVVFILFFGGNSLVN